MGKYTRSPSLLQEVGTIAGMYRTVFWMMGQRLHRGKDWEEELTREALRVQSLQTQPGSSKFGRPQHN